MAAGLTGAPTACSSADQDAEAELAAAQQLCHADVALRITVAALPERERRLIELHFVHGRDFREIATVLAVSYATVRRIRDRAVRTLGLRLRALGIDRAALAAAA